MSNEGQAARYSALVWMGVLAGLGILIYLLAPILTPFLISVLLAYMWDPVIDRLETWRINRVVGIVIVYVLLSLILLVVFLVLAPILQDQVGVFVGKLPGYFDWINNTVFPWLSETLALGSGALELNQVKHQVLANWQDMGAWLGGLGTYITQSGMRFLAWTINLVLIPVVTFYLLRDWDVIVARIHDLMPPRYQGTVASLARQTDEVLGSFVRGQVVVMLVLGVIYSVGLWLLGLDLALPIGLLAGLVSFVPYLGFIVGLLAAGVAALLQFKTGMPLVWVLAVFGVGQILEATVLTPRLVGERVGLHPVAVIFAIMAGGQLFGFFGILLAIPVAAALMVWLRYLHSYYQAQAQV